MASAKRFIHSSSLTAERLILTYVKGRAQYVWRLKENGYKRNEPLDIRNYATVALEIGNPQLDKPEKPEGQKPARKRGRRKLSGGIT